MDIKNTISYLGDSAQIASVKKIEKPDQPASVGQGLENDLGKRISAGQEALVPKAQKQKVEKALFDVNQFFQAERRILSFSVNDTTKDVVIEVKDAKTNEVIRQIPPEFVVKLAEHLTELSDESGDSAGLLLKDKA